MHGGAVRPDGDDYSGLRRRTLLVIQKDELLRVLHAEREFSDRFIAYMLAHNIRVEEEF